MRKGWEEREWNDVLEIRSGRGYKNVLVENGKYPIIGSAGKVMGYANDYICEGGTTIVGRKGTINNPMFIDKPFWNVDTAFGLHAKTDLEKMFLHYFCLGFDFSKMDRGSGRPSLVKSDLLKIKMFVPPLPEQQRIVSLLDEAFAAIDQAKANAEKNLQNAKEMFDLTLNNILTDEKWKITQLGDVCDKVEYGTSTKSQPTGKIPVLRMGNIQNGKFDWDKLVYSDNELDNAKYLLKYNDVLFNRTNSPELVGKTAIYKGERPAIFAGYLIRFHRKENLLDADYLNYFLNSNLAFEYGKTVVSSSVNQANINGTKLKAYPIPLPTLEEQQTIVEQLDNLHIETQQLETLYQKKIAALDELKKSILQKAFRGELGTEK